MTTNLRSRSWAPPILAVLPWLVLSACMAAVESEAMPESGGDQEAVASTSEALLGIQGIKYYFDAPTPNTVNVCCNGAFMWTHYVTENGIFAGNWQASVTLFDTDIGWIQDAIAGQWGGYTGLKFNFYRGCPPTLQKDWIPI